MVVFIFKFLDCRVEPDNDKEGKSWSCHSRESGNPESKRIIFRPHKLIIIPVLIRTKCFLYTFACGKVYIIP